MTDLARRLTAEALGSASLVATVVGSGIMAQTLTADVALALLANTLATGAILVALITVFGPVSGAHFNPAVSLAFWMRGALATRLLALYVPAQILGAIGGTLAAHLMFEQPALSGFGMPRTGTGQWLAELLATFGLIGTILGALRSRPEAVPTVVGLYITAAYWFTSSTSFANPAVAIGRAFTGSFAGIRPADLPGFITAEMLGAALAAPFFGWLFSTQKGSPA